MRNFFKQLAFTTLFALALGQGLFYYFYLEAPTLAAPSRLTRQFQAQAISGELKLVGDWWPPQIGIRTPIIHTDYASANITLSSNEPIADYQLPETWELIGPQRSGEVYLYLLNIPQVAAGENYYTVEFSDDSGNAISKDLYVAGSSSPLQTPSWPDTQFTLDGDNLLSLANKQYQLPQDYAPQDLVYLSDLGIVNVNAARLREEPAKALQQMTAAITQAGINYNVTSGYRSFADQVRVYNYWVGYYAGNIAATDQVSARPGYSEHQLGLALDFTTSANGNIFYRFETTPLSNWLANHAHEYGFVLSYPSGKTEITGYSYEPWHYRYVGIENARKILESGLTPTEWLLIQRPSL